MALEHSPKPEPDREVVAAYATTFIPRYDMYPLQLPDGRYVSLKKRLHLDLVTADLRGMITIGAYALDEHSHAKWICFDADDEDASQVRTGSIPQIMAALRNATLNALRRLHVTHFPTAFINNARQRYSIVSTGVCTDRSSVIAS